MVGKPTRRSWIKGASIGATSLIAGCNNLGDSGNKEKGTPPEWVEDKTFVTSEAHPVQNMDFNPYNPLWVPDRIIMYMWGNIIDGVLGIPDDPLPALATGLERDGNSVTINLDDRFTWWDGKPVTADDLAIRHTLDLLAQNRNWERIFEDVHVIDDHTYQVIVTTGANDNVVRDSIYNSLIATHPEVYGKFLPEDGSRGAGAYDHLSTFERQKKAAQLSSVRFKGPWKEGSGYERRVIGWGPWKMADWGDRTITLELYEDHPFADRINFPTVVFKGFTTDQARYQALLSHNFSGIEMSPTETVWNQLNKDRYQTLHHRNGQAGAMAFNYDTFPDHRVRQAMAYALNKEEVVKNAGMPEVAFFEHKFESGYPANREKHDKFFGENFVDELTKYPKDVEKASDLLREAGWEKRDGQWHDQNNKEVELTVKTPVSWIAWVNIGKSITEELEEFGIKTEFKTEELVVYYAQTMIQSDYDIALWWIGLGSFPWINYDAIWNSLQTIADEHNHPDEYDMVPKPIGDPNGSEGTMTVNVQETLGTIATSRLGTEEIRDSYRKIAWTYNQMLPVYTFAEYNTNLMLDTYNWQGPFETEDAEVYSPLSYWQHRGLIKALK